jgi:pyruvate-ferredoxin/flavodoxin oxidoreductase
MRQGPREVERKNFEAVDDTLARLAGKVAVPDLAVHERISDYPATHGRGSAPEFVREVTARMMAGRGDELAVSAFPRDGTYPTGTARWEKRDIARGDPGLGPRYLHPVRQLRLWSARTRSCGPSSTIRTGWLDAPEAVGARHDAGGFPDIRYTLQVYP